MYADEDIIYVVLCQERDVINRLGRSGPGTPPEAEQSDRWAEQTRQEKRISGRRYLVLTPEYYTYRRYILSTRKGFRPRERRSQNQYLFVPKPRQSPSQAL